MIAGSGTTADRLARQRLEPGEQRVQPGVMLRSADEVERIVDAVVVEPWGAHPSYVQGAYDRDNRFYLDWDPISRDEDAIQR